MEPIHIQKARTTADSKAEGRLMVDAGGNIKKKKKKALRKIVRKAV